MYLFPRIFPPDIAALHYTATSDAAKRADSSGCTATHASLLRSYISTSASRTCRHVRRTRASARRVRARGTCTCAWRVRATCRTDSSERAFPTTAGPWRARTHRAQAVPPAGDVKLRSRQRRTVRPTPPSLRVRKACARNARARARATRSHPSFIAADLPSDDADARAVPLLLQRCLRRITSNPPPRQPPLSSTPAPRLSGAGMHAHLRRPPVGERVVFLNELERARPVPPACTCQPHPVLLVVDTHARM